MLEFFSEFFQRKTLICMQRQRSPLSPSSCRRKHQIVWRLQRSWVSSISEVFTPWDSLLFLGCVSRRDSPLSTTELTLTLRRTALWVTFIGGKNIPRVLFFFLDLSRVH
jgi:hypothetical protein